MSSPLSWSVFEYTEVASTQDVAKERVRDGSAAPFVVCADHQTAGKGRAGRSWSSMQGNVMATLVLPLSFDMRYAANFSFLTAVALSETVYTFCKEPLPKIEHKWPNDVWVNDQKLAGILLEVYKDHLLIGTGVNVTSSPDGAVALNDFSAWEVAPRQFLQSFLKQLDFDRDLMLKEGFEPIRQKWLDRARGIGAEITIRTLRETFHGVFDGIEHDGALRVLIEGQEKPRIVYAGDVFFGKEEGPDVARH